jgi:hypothetical protein
MLRKRALLTAEQATELQDSRNPYYALQLLYDSLQDLSERVAVDATGLVRPHTD